MFSPVFLIITFTLIFYNSLGKKEALDIENERCANVSTLFFSSNNSYAKDVESSLC
jgi:hypothetical protein